MNYVSIKKEKLDAVTDWFKCIQTEFDTDPDKFLGISREWFDEFYRQIQSLTKDFRVFQQLYLKDEEWPMFYGLIKLPLVKAMNKHFKVTFLLPNPNVPLPDFMRRDRVPTSVMIRVGRQYLIHHFTNTVLTDNKEEATVFNQKTDPSSHLLAFEKDRLMRAGLAYEIVSSPTVTKTNLSIVS
jgi:hypothetical protein